MPGLERFVSRPRSVGLSLGGGAVPEAELAARGDEAVAVAGLVEGDKALVEGNARLLQQRGGSGPRRR